MSVRTDVINLTVNVNGNPAQNQLNELRKKAADLTFEMNGLKKGTSDYIAKATELKQVTAEMSNLKQEIGLTALSVKELNAERSKLTSLRNSVSPETKDWKNYDTQLQAVVARHKELTGGVQSIQSFQEKVGEGFKTLGVRVLEYIGIYGAIDVITEFFSSTIEETNKAEAAVSNLKNTLENAGRLDLFEVLNEQSEKFAEIYKRINANDIKNVFSKLIDYGKLTQTQITSLTDVIINYAAKQKISVTEATDVFTKALEGNSKGLKTYGINIRDATNFGERLSLILGPMADKVRGAEAAFESTNKGAWQVFLENIVRTKERLGELIFSLVATKKSAEEVFDKAKEKTDNYENSLKPLLTRYDELKKKTTLNKDEQTELHGIIEKIAQVLPSAVTAFDAYGNAMDINRGKVQNFLDSNQKFLAEKEFKAVQELTDKAKKTFQDLQKQTDELQRGDITEFQGGGGTGGGGGRLVTRKATDDEQRQQLADLHTLQEKLINDAATLQEKYGKTLPDSIVKGIDAIKAQFSAVDDVNKKLAKNEKVIGNGDPEAEQKKRDAKDAKKAADDAEAEFERLKKEADKFYQDIQKLKLKAQAGDLSDRDKEVQEVENKYAELLQKAKDFYSKGVANASVYNDEVVIISKKTFQDIAALRKKFFEQDSEKEFQDSLNASDEYFAGLRDQEAKSYADRKISKAQFEENIKDIEFRELNQRIRIATDYQGTSKKAAKDLSKFKVDLEHAETKDKQEQTDKRLVLEKEEAAAIRAIRDIQINDPDTSPAKRQKLQTQNAKEDRDAQINKLKQDLQESGQAFDDEALKSNTIFQKIWAQFNENIKQINKSTWVAEVENVLQYVSAVQDALSSLNTILSNSENAQLAKDQKINDEKTKALKKQLDSKLISQKKYDSEVQKLTDEQDKKDRKIKHDQAVREKGLALFSAIISTARGVAEAFPNLLKMGLIAALGALQITAVASQPVPEAGEGVWLRSGPKHSDREGGIHILAERDEAIVKAKAMTDRRRYTVTGTPSQITSRLNSMHGGVNWASGAMLNTRPVINSRMPNIMAQGGIVSPLKSSSGELLIFDSVNVAALLKRANELSEIHIQETKDSSEKQIAEQRNAKDRLQAIVSIKEYRKVEQDYNKAQRNSGIN